MGGSGGITGRILVATGGSVVVVVVVTTGGLGGGTVTATTGSFLITGGSTLITGGIDVAVDSDGFGISLISNGSGTSTNTFFSCCSVTIGLLIYLLHNLRVALIKDFKAKYDFINTHEVAWYKWTFYFIGMSVGFLM